MVDQSLSEDSEVEVEVLAGASTSTTTASRSQKRKNATTLQEERAPKRRQSAPAGKENRPEGRTTRESNIIIKPALITKRPRQPVQARTHTAPDKGGLRPPTSKLYYDESLGEIPEAEASIFLEDDDLEEKFDGNDDSKPVRFLTNFTIFDPRHKNELVSLHEMEAPEPTIDREFEASGDVRPVLDLDEDEGQEDDGNDEQGVDRIRLSAILRFWTDYTQDAAAVWVETVHAWYILECPASDYECLYTRFLKPIRVAQFVLSTILSDSRQARQNGKEPALVINDLRAALHRHSTPGLRFHESDLDEAAPGIIEALNDLDQEDYNIVDQHPAVQHFIPKKRRTRGSRLLSAIRAPSARSKRPKIRNLDLAVLRKEAQCATHVTPAIYELSRGYFNGDMVVIGSKPAPQDLGPSPRMVLECITKYWQKSSHEREIDLGECIASSQYAADITVDDVTYRSGDCVVMLAGPDGGKPGTPVYDESLCIPMGSVLADFFWFAKIINIYDSGEIHVQWFVASSRTTMGEISDPHELFLIDHCEDLDVNVVLGKIVVHDTPSKARRNAPDEFFCQFTFDSALGVYKDTKTALVDPTDPSSLCPICPAIAARKQQEVLRRVASGGVAWRGSVYHPYDFVKIKNKAHDGPCRIGQVHSIKVSKLKDSLEAVMRVRLAGRVATLTELPPQKERDERELFLTDEEERVPIGDIISACHVIHRDAVNDLRSWLSRSPDHFYAQYHFPAVRPRDWAEREAISEIVQCKDCLADKALKLKLDKIFQTSAKKSLRAFDPFAGVGAFGRGLEESGCINVTHSVEISPSACETLRINSAEMTIFNQDSNKILEYAIKTHEDRAADITDLYTDSDYSQPHSGLNMYKKTDDRKSNLILNLLSWVDFLKPDYCLFENVRGFLSYRLNATQASEHRTEGGIENGGLKFLLRAMVALGYQAQFGLLDAGRHGAPQGRVRFFLIAAKGGLTLPKLPRPSHEFSGASLQIQLEDGVIKPINTEAGIASLPFVSIEDAIGDLPLFDWKSSENTITTEIRVSRDIPAVACDNARPSCGIHGPAEYRHKKPLTTFQRHCRANEDEIEDLQHVTRTYPEATVER
ncbi:hypothetical protein HWV62_10266 [Athelia sp. TMB]|nr:hypothetical protein HWV62_10266 [Athelia sp. TMB]